jgi:glycerol-3-phosphate dehydrogenase
MAVARSRTLGRLANETFDVLVVGGGATGAAVARDAALRGLAVALCDRADFGGETSAHSSKLIHGGLRYLEHGAFPLVFEALAERRRLLRTAPHLCRPTEFLFPAYKGEDPSLFKLTVGVTLYDALALWRAPVRSRRLDPAEVHGLAPLLRTAGLKGALAYVDCQTDDTRLVLENVLDAEAASAVVASYLELATPPPWRGHLTNVTARDRVTGEVLTIQARAVVNATGPFSDAFRAASGRVLRPTLGVHIVLDAQRVPNGGRAFVIRHPRDNRVMFVLPDGARTIIGTTDTDWQSGPGGSPRPGDDIRARGADVDYLLEAANNTFPATGVGPGDVISTFAGLRPLLGTGESNPSANTREHAIWVDRRGVLTVAGGKLTTMRRMGEEVVDQLIELLRQRGVDRPLAASVTRTRPLPGGAGADGSPENVERTLAALHEIPDDVSAHLALAYGQRAPKVLALAAISPEGPKRLIPGLPYLEAEVLFATREEHATEVEDVLRRRIPAFRADHQQGLGCAPRVADLLAAELAWSDVRRDQSLAAYKAAVEQSRGWQKELG